MPNSDGEVAMNEAHEKLRELLVAIRSVLTKYKECDFELDRGSVTELQSSFMLETRRPSTLNS